MHVTIDKVIRTIYRTPPLLVLRVFLVYVLIII